MREKRSDFPSGHDALDGLFLGAVADDHRDAAIHRPEGGVDLGVHAAGAHLGLLPELDGTPVIGAEGVQHLRAVLPRRQIVDAIDVAHEDQQIRLDLGRQHRRQGIVVLDGYTSSAATAGDFLVDVRRRRHRVVRVDDRHDIQADQLAQRAEEVLTRLLVVKVGLGHQHLGDLDSVLREHRVVEGHETRLAYRGGRSRFQHVS